MTIAVGSTNPAKLKAAKLAVNKLFPKAKIVGVNVKSGVSDQPMSDEESIRGTVNRARRALSEVEWATYGIGMEGGIQLIGRRYFECGWIAVVDKNGKVGLGSSGRFQVASKIMKRVLKGEELGITFDKVTGIENTKHKEGAMGIVTNGHLPRATAYSHGVFFAFAPFISDKKFWE
ncbi:inosine/xanthosine triphosphatase [Candidatus Microgenomates bacterium]|nr:inosine/xanthosine triphosphatase [Candidatus Microgenomates bacterium]